MTIDAEPRVGRVGWQRSAVRLSAVRLDTFGHLPPGQDAETVRRLPDMTQPPEDASFIPPSPLAPLIVSHQVEAQTGPPELQHLAQHIQRGQERKDASGSDSVQNDLEEGEAETAYENGDL